MKPIHAVVFDLGGVLARISRTWQEAALAVGIQTKLPERPVPLDEFPLWNDHESGAVGDEDYLAALAIFLGCPVEDAKRAHCGIPYVEYEGVGDLVKEIQSRGILTGCLSNTNAMHWEELRGPRFPTIASLDLGMPSHETGLRKPDPRIFDFFCAQFGQAPEGIVYFDDLPANVEAAKSVGWRSHWVDPTGDPPAQIRSILVTEGLILNPSS